MSARSVLDFLEKYQELTGIWMPLNSVALGAEQYVSETDPSAFAAADGRTAEKPWTLAQVDEMRVLKKTLGGAFKKFDLLSESAKGKVRAHISKYEWKGSHHLSVHQFTVKELMKQMAEDKSIQRPKSRRDIEPYLVGLLDLLGFVRFRCAEASGKSSYYLAPLLSELAEKHNVSYDDVVEHTIDEIAKGTITKAIAEKRRKSTGFLFDKRKIVLTDKQVQECANVLLGGAIASEVQGIAACKGIAKGVVKLVRSKEEMKGFEKGMILVAYETTPDVVSAMKKAGAIVTDFGGLTSHAAIISREFGIPCIVGTKNATKVLKDGDMVEVDADKGVVRKV
jgi:phosphohistidine swiveling domain-containing protein